ncbi:hypothetical protein [Geopseudomonas aromaticivorans]
MSDENVIEIGDFSLARKVDNAWQRRREKACEHRNLDLEPHGEVVRCRDCGTQVSAFWALGMLADNWRERSAQLQRKEQQAEQDLKSTLHLRAARLVESAWRSRDTLPTCPHCGEGIAPSDGLGSARVSKPIDAARREARRALRAKPAQGSHERDGAKAHE